MSLDPVASEGDTFRVASEAELAALSAALGGPGQVRTVSPTLVARARERIAAGYDPLGEAFSALRSPEARRPLGATYTPLPIVRAMIDWAARRIDPVRVVDPGCGSGRFLVAAGRTFPSARLVGIEIDPLAALAAKGHLAAAGLSGRAEIMTCDYRGAALEPVSGRTLFAGNPPYVRHHRIGASWKSWLSRTARARGLQASQLAGLHVHFFLATLLHARAGDVGTFITAAEWLDVNYGRLARELLAGPLGLLRLDVADPEGRAFEDALTTAAVAGFEVGCRAPTVRFRRAAAAELARPTGGRQIAREVLARATRWTPLLRPRRRISRGWVELGELCAVHRGQVTGSNGVWIADDRTPDLPPAYLVPSITRARELFAAGAELGSCDRLRRVVDLPAELDALSPAERTLVDRFLRWARRRGGHESYIARHRAPWWSVKLRAPAPILATYMARRPPAFVRNAVGARHINIAHGIYPRQPLGPAALDALAAHLRATVTLVEGRVYAGGLTKFEPGEMERLPVPPVEALSPSGEAAFDPVAPG